MKMRKIFNLPVLNKNEEFVIKNNGLYIKNNFNVGDWIGDMYTEYLKDTSIMCTVYRGTTIIISKNSHCMKVGISRCALKDTFNTAKGIAIAYARYKGIEIPAEVLE